MRKIRFLLFLSLCYASSIAFSQTDVASPQPAQPPSSAPVLHPECKKQKDPFASYCEDIYTFRDMAKDVSHHNRDAGGNDTGKVNRLDRDVRSAMMPFLDLSGVLGGGSDPTRFTSLRAQEIALESALRALSSGENQGRPDQQTTAGSSTSGTTSLVEKAGAPAILAFALESGALTRSVSGNTATLSANADGLLRAITGQQVLCFDCPEGSPLGTLMLKNINLSATFAINQQSLSTVDTTGVANSSTPPDVTSVTIPTSTGKLSSFTARYQIWNRFDPRDKGFRDEWDKAVTTAHDEIDKKAKALQNDLQNLLIANPLKNDGKFTQLLTQYQTIFFDDVDNGNMAQLQTDFLELYNATVSALARDDPGFNQRAAIVNLSLAEYRNLWTQLLDQAKGHPLFTLQYTFNRSPSQPETHDLQAVLSYAPKSAIGLLSLNASISLYGGTIPAGAKYGRLHDGQIAAEYDRPIKIKDNPNQGTFSLAAYWQYQPDPSVLNITSGNLAPGTNIDLPANAQVLLGTAGSLWVTQAKFTINGKSGIKVPFAVRWANKTDLLSGNKLGAQVGISYDFSSLSSVFGGGQ